MAVLLDGSGRELLWLTVLCDGTPCVSTMLSDPAVMRFVAPRCGRLTMLVKNVAIAPACFFSLHRQLMDPASAWNDAANNLVNDFNVIYVGWQEEVSRDASTGRAMLVEPTRQDDGRAVLVSDPAAAAAPRTRFRLSVSPAARDCCSTPTDLSRATWQRKTVPQAAPPLNVILARATGGLLDLQLHQSSLISEVKDQIRCRTCVSFERNGLFWRGEELQNARAVGDYPIQNGDLLEVKPAGGVQPATPTPGALRAVPFVYPDAQHFPDDFSLREESRASGCPTPYTAAASLTPGQGPESEPRPRHDQRGPHLMFEVFYHWPS
ncbi:uncharacterized protein LOC117646678 [Thrips palmi]|uniref:Uncharacterized protein LOC117646678 n=1 Tax=Thrips palmi TaxID=161013 RepID=A0A6P8Z219_THRPL|nr:uncharacterized protein LOC117646678 [Thrips palmi]XP_034243689.1 uncharacterized protein LOC117646678 [Thrips palmi]